MHGIDVTVNYYCGHALVYTIVYIIFHNLYCSTIQLNHLQAIMSQPGRMDIWLGFYKLCSFFCDYAIPAMLVFTAIMPQEVCYYAPNYA